MDRQPINTPLGPLPELPAQARTRSGVEFDPRADNWAYRDGITAVSLNFAKWPVTEFFKLSAKSTLLWYAEHMAPKYLINVQSILSHYLKIMAGDTDKLIEQITNTDLMNYRSALTENTAYYLGQLAVSLKRWHRLGYPGVTDDAVKLLQQLRVKNRPTGEAVLTHDPLHGPFTDIEIESIQVSLNQAHVNGSVNRESYILIYLFMLLGQRPSSMLR